MGSQCDVCGKKPVKGNQYCKRGKAKYLGGVGTKVTGISRRTFLDRAQKFAVGGVTATALFEMLRPNYAWAVQVEKNDNRNPS